MKTQPHTILAIGTWQGRVSPVLDVTRSAEIVEIDCGRVERRDPAALPDDPWAKPEALAAAGVQVLVCGAVSAPLRERLDELGIEVQAFLAGDVEEVLAAWLAGRLGEPRFAMPGCCGGRRRRRHGQCGRGVCRCPQCGREIPHQAGWPCRELTCPVCHSHMIGG